jgi:hypothetical protein
MTDSSSTRTDHPRRPGPRRPAGARVVLIGAPSPLRSAIARQLGSATTVLACLDSPAGLMPGPPAAPGGRAAGPRATGARASAGAAGVLAPGARAAGDRGGLAGATVVLVTTPRPPGLAGRLRHWWRDPALRAGLGQAAAAAYGRGATRVVAVSTAFRYGGDDGRPLPPAAPVLAAPETGPAAAAEEAAGLFRRLGGDSVVLRLGWTCGAGDDLTRQVLAGARRGWRLIDGDPGAWTALVGEADAARAVVAALAAPPGCYHVTDGAPVTQGELNAGLERALGRPLHTLGDPGWSAGGTLFGPSRLIRGQAFGDLTGWRPRAVPAATVLASAGRRGG